MAPDTKERWKREVGWLLSVTDHVVEFVPTRQTAENGTTMEVLFLSFFLFFFPATSSLQFMPWIGPNSS